LQHDRRSRGFSIVVSLIYNAIAGRRIPAEAGDPTLLETGRLFPA
jgi:hypothetical protein